jgi:hypothetical protein
MVFTFYAASALGQMLESKIMMYFKGVFMKVRRNKAIMLMAIGITAILLPILIVPTNQTSQKPQLPKKKKSLPQEQMEIAVSSIIMGFQLKLKEIYLMVLNLLIP